MPNVHLNYVAHLRTGLVYYLRRQLLAEERSLATALGDDSLNEARIKRLVYERVEAEITAFEEHLRDRSGLVPEAHALFAERQDLFEWQCKSGIWLVYRVHQERLTRWYQRLLPAKRRITILQILYCAATPSRNSLFLARLAAEIPPE